jgi:hypothetical protein
MAQALPTFFIGNVIADEAFGGNGNEVGGELAEKMADFPFLLGISVRPAPP